MRSRGARAARGTIAAVVATFLAVFFHAIADGCTPNALGVIITLAFAVPVCTLLAGKTLSRGRLAVAIAASQTVFHTTMSWGDASLATSTGSSAHVGHHGSAPSSVLVLGESAGHADHDAGMWLAHVIAAALTFAVLRYAEGLFWELLQRTGFPIAAALLTLGALRPAVAEHVPAPAGRPARLAPRLVVLGSMRHRGPPLACA
ncbi:MULTISPECIES: hypothetical protein [unclassified Rathayibacter]|uniref:hypothetical protein n=1 Tax=unclassified Rathayibacter TaxID=2609250 RepID=UPI00188C38E7|nr:MULTISPECIES: hypothetical protein [unclassified Rathayibacter]MBF4461952.1 hypothetical protein [Rathayibacter sp. VKM Ac-2879]MBF4504005.1 hypothetical protein [Rathayibacter sp. VKM Ac-2878]